MTLYGRCFQGFYGPGHRVSRASGSRASPRRQPHSWPGWP